MKIEKKESMANPLFPFSDEEDTLMQEFEQAVFMDDTKKMEEEWEKKRG